MRRRHTRSVLAAVAVLAVACGASDEEAAAPTSAVAQDHADHDDQADHDEHTHHDHHGEVADEGDADIAPPADRAGPGQGQIDAMLALPEDVVRSAHDHTGHDHDHGSAAEARAASVRPERLVIPAIGVDADVIELGLQSDGSMEVPADFAQTGWFEPGPRPGRVGPAVIAGHVDSTAGPAVFYDLARLTPGDLIEVHGAEGDVVTFAVRELEQHPKDDFPTEAVYGGTAGPELRLITCSGDFDREARSYRDNTIVFAERVDP